MSYRVTLPMFEGPFDLLLHLIKMNEMDIYQIPIADITQKYLEYIQHLQEAVDLDIAGDFLVIASHLVSLKAKQLLPADSADGTHDLADPSRHPADALFERSPREFMRQLIAYRKFKDLARQLSHRQAEQARLFYRSVPPPAAPEPVRHDDEENGPGLDALLEAFARVLRYIDQREGSHTVEAERFTVEDKILHLQDVLPRQQMFDVTEEFGRCFTKAEMIATFLAILELVRLKKVKIIQDKAFGRIGLQWIEEEAPTETESPDAELQRAE